MSDFTEASQVTSVAENVYRAELSADWTVGDKPHGGYLLALLARAGVAALDGIDPLALSAEFLRPPSAGPATLHTEIRKTGRTASVVAVRLEQDGRDCVMGTLTAGALPDEDSAWTDLPDFAAEPEADSLDFGSELEGPSKVGKRTELRISRRNGAIFTDRRAGDPLQLRGWVRLPPEHTDVFFALVACDVLPPLTFNLGRLGWSPTVQLTALLRAKPAPGWLRVQTEARSVTGSWFDSDATVLDSRGRLICQARQLALTAR